MKEVDVLIHSIYKKTLLFILFTSIGINIPFRIIMGRKYALGDEIIRCKTPFAYVVNQEIVQTICDQCLKRTSTDENSRLQEFLRCSGK